MLAGSGPHVISPGGHGSVGVLTMGSLYMTSNTTLDLSDFSGSSTDQIVMQTGGSLNFSGGGTATLILPAGLSNATYTLIDAKAAGTVTDTSNFTVSGGLPSWYTLSWDNTNYDLLLIAGTAPGNYWQGAASANWSSAGSWSGGLVPNAVGAVAAFNGGGSSPAIVDMGITIGQLTFTGSQSYTVSGASTLTMSNTGGSNAVISLTSGAAAQTVSAPMLLSSNLTVTSNANGVTLSGNISGTGQGITLAGGLLTLKGTNTYTGTTTVSGGVLLANGGGDATLGGQGAIVLSGGTLRLALPT